MPKRRKKENPDALNEYLQLFFKRSINLGFMPAGPYQHAAYLMTSDASELEHKEIMSKDAMLGNISSPEMISFLLDDKDMLTSWSEMAKEDPLLEEFYKSLVLAWLAEFRITRSSGGFERAAQGSPNGDFFGMNPRGYGLPESPEEQKKGGIFDFLKGKKLLGGNPPNPAEQNIQKRW